MKQLTQNELPQLIAEVQISYSVKIKAKDRRKITCSNDAAIAFRSIFPSLEHVEYCYLMMLNRRNDVLGYYQLSKGGITGTVIDIRIVFQVALQCCATSLIMAHNHPSGNLEASNADKSISKKIKEGAVILDIPLMDHLIITTDSYLSMADEGLL